MSTVLVSQDTPTVYLRVPRASFDRVNTSVLPALCAAGLGVDVLTSARSFMSLGAPGALDAATADMRALPPAHHHKHHHRRHDPPKLLPPGSGPVFVRVTASEERLLEEAERIAMPLPLNPVALRAADVVRNRAERFAGDESVPEGELSIPAAFGEDARVGAGGRADPYACHYAPYKRRLPAVTAAALGSDASPSPLFSRRASASGGGAGVLSDVAALKLIVSVIASPSTRVEDVASAHAHAHPHSPARSPSAHAPYPPSSRGAGLNLSQLRAAGVITSAFAGHSCAEREVVNACVREAVVDMRSFGFGSVLYRLRAALCGERCRSSSSRGSASGRKSDSGGGGGCCSRPRGATAGHDRRKAALEGVGAGEEASLDQASSFPPPFRRASEYMRGYFGETVGFYFGLTELYQSTMSMLALAGVAFFAAQQQAGSTAAVTWIAPYAFLTSAWAVVFLSLWHRRQSSIAQRWGTVSFLSHEPLRPEYEAAPQTALGRSPVDGRLSYAASPWTQCSRLVASWAATVVAMAITTAICGAIFFGRLLLNAYSSSAIGDNATVLINTLWIVLGNILWGLVSDALTAWETHPTASAHERSAVLKSSLFRIINTYVGLFYISLQIKNYVSFGALSDACAPDCINELQTQLAVQLVSNWAASLLALYGTPWLLQCLQRCTFCRCCCCRRGGSSVNNSNSNTAASATTDPAQAAPPDNNASDAVPASLLHAADAAANRGRLAALAPAADGTDGSLCEPGELWLRIVHESEAGETPLALLYFISLLQFGYVALFSAAFPLAGLIAIVSNAIGTRFDLYWLLHRSTRSLPQAAQDIGAWSFMFHALAILAILSNCVVISVSNPKPVFGITWVDEWTLKLAYFIAAESVIFIFKFVLDALLGTQSAATILAAQRGKYMLAKHLYGAREHPDTRVVFMREQLQAEREKDAAVAAAAAAVASPNGKRGASTGGPRRVTAANDKRAALTSGGPRRVVLRRSQVPSVDVTPTAIRVAATDPTGIATPTKDGQRH